METANEQARNNLSVILREINARLDAHDQSIGIIRENVDAHEESIETIRENVTDRRKTEAMFFAVTSDVSQMVGPSLNLLRNW